MKAEVKKLWVKALRGGKYKQGRGILRNTRGGYCCLGVLCDLYHKDTGRGNWTKTIGGHWSFLDTSDFLPFAVQKWAGLRKERPVIDPKREISLEGYADQVNDKRGSDFKQIAALIEKNL